MRPLRESCFWDTFVMGRMGKIAVKKIETIDTNHVKIGEAIPQDELLMGDTNLDPPVQEEPPLMGVPVIMPAENQILERGEAVIRDEE